MSHGCVLRGVAGPDLKPDQIPHVSICRRLHKCLFGVSRSYIMFPSTATCSILPNAAYPCPCLRRIFMVCFFGPRNSPKPQSVFLERPGFSAPFLQLVTSDSGTATLKSACSFEPTWMDLKGTAFLGT